MERRAFKRIVIVSGNGGGDPKKCNWYESVRAELQAFYGGEVEVILPFMPESFVAPEKVWVPHLVDLVKGETETAIVVGHSSGAEAAMRLAESRRLHGMVLVSACWTDLGDEHEAKSGYYGRPWEWQKQKENVATKIVQFGSLDDPLVPYQTEQMHVARELDTNLITLTNAGHIWDRTFPELVAFMKKTYP